MTISIAQRAKSARALTRRSYAARRLSAFRRSSERSQEASAPGANMPSSKKQKLGTRQREIGLRRKFTKSNKDRSPSRKANLRRRRIGPRPIRKSCCQKGLLRKRRIINPRNALKPLRYLAKRCCQKKARKAKSRRCRTCPRIRSPPRKKRAKKPSQRLTLSWMCPASSPTLSSAPPTLLAPRTRNPRLPPSRKRTSRRASIQLKLNQSEAGRSRNTAP